MKKLISLIAVLSLIITTLTGCTATTKIKVDSAGKISGNMIMNISDREYRAFCEGVAIGSGADVEEVYEASKADLLKDGFVEKVDAKGNIYYQSKEKLKIDKDIKNEIHPTYCNITTYLSDDDKETMADYSDFSEGFKVKLKLTFPYDVKSANGTISEDKRTVTWDLLKMEKKNKPLKAYTVKYNR